jgi:two-component system chemotaxis response regulator CheB
MPHKVMLVEDAAMMRLVISNFIAPLPEFEIVASAANGKAALEQLKTHPDIELILLDIEMPEMDGFDFLRHAKLRTRAKIVILSSVTVAGSPHAAKARELGADAIVTKPSGAVSMDLAGKRGSQLVQTMKALIG